MFARAVRLAALAFVFASAAAVSQAQEEDKTAAFDTKMRDANAMLARRQFEDALRIFKDANSLQDKKSSKAQIGMARAYQGLQAHKSAADACTDALKYANGDPALELEARNLRGISLFSLGEKPDDKRFKQAEEDFRAVLAMSDQYPIARYNLGVVLLKQGRDDEGSTELKGFLEGNDRHAEAANARRFIENPRRARERFAPDFSITTLSGEFLTLEDLKGKVVLIDFWATWCKPCLLATPGLSRLAKKFKDEPFVILGISADRERDAWKNFVDEHKLDWPHFLDAKRTMANGFGVTGYPSYILLDHEGIVRFTKVGWGPTTDGEIESQARKLLRAIPPATR
jgi:peroxiredoxin/Flp pilus assembly protein TadD